MRTSIVLASLLAFAGCVGGKPTPTAQKLLDCTDPVVQAVLPDLEAQALAILTGGKPDCQQMLDDLLASSGPAVVCAVQVAVTALSGAALPTTLASEPKLPDVSPAGRQLAVAQGVAWLAVNGHGALVRPARMAIGDPIMESGVPLMAGPVHIDPDDPVMNEPVVAQWDSGGLTFWP